MGRTENTEVHRTIGSTCTAMSKVVNINDDPRLGSKLDPNSETDSHLANNNLDQSSVANPPLDPSNNPRTCKVGIRRIPPEVTSSLLSIWQVDGAVRIARR